MGSDGHCRGHGPILGVGHAFFIIIIHEWGHIFAARRFKWRIRQIFLLPFGGVAEFDEAGSRPQKEELVIVLSGPAQQIWLMALALLLPENSVITEKTTATFLELNAMVLLFNLLPIFPLDGGRLMAILFSYFFPYMKAQKMVIMISLSFLLAYCFILFLFSPFHLNGWLVAAFLGHALWKEWKNRPYHFFRFLIHLEKLPASTRMVKRKTIFVQGEEPLKKVLERFYRGVEHQIVVLENRRIIGTLGGKKLLERFFERKSWDLPIKNVFMG